MHRVEPLLPSGLFTRPRYGALWFVAIRLAILNGYIRRFTLVPTPPMMNPSPGLGVSSSAKCKEHPLEIRKATEQDLDAIVELDRQIGQIHFEQAPEVFCPPSSRQRAFLLDAIQSEG